LQDEEKTKEEAKEEETKEEEPWEECKGSFPDSCYPTPPPNFEERMPDNMPPTEEEEPKDEWYCPHCRSSPCVFLQYQNELERQVNIMYPEVTNKQKRYHVYRHMSRRLYSHLG
jgi:hypothetical protein